MKVLALSGYKGSGKDTVAVTLKECGYEAYSFASALKDTVASQYGIDRTWLDNTSRKEAPLLQYPVKPKDAFSENICNFMLGEFRDAKGCSINDKECDAQLYWVPRALAILEGSIKRSVNSNYWVDKVINSIKNSPSKYAVITDLRYKSEIEALRAAFENKLTTVEIKRFSTVNSADPSERDLDNVQRDIIIYNDKDLLSLKEQVVNKLIMGK